MKNKFSFKAVLAVIAFALIFGTLSGTKVHAEEKAELKTFDGVSVEYDALSDSLVVKPKTTISSGTELNLFFSGKSITSWKTANVKPLDMDDLTDKNKDATGDDKDTTVGHWVPITGLNIKVTADGYFAVSDVSAPAEGDATFIVNATEYKKPVVSLNYAVAYAGNKDLAIASVVYAPTDRNSTKVTEVAGDTKDLLAGAKKAFEKIEFSLDGTTWASVYDSEGKAVFTGDELAKLVTAANGTKTYVYFRVAGVSANKSELGKRPSDAQKLTVAKAQSAIKSVKVDVKKVANLAIKQKTDYQVVINAITATPTPTPSVAPTSADGAGGADPTATPTPTAIPVDDTKWISVLPYNKDGLAVDAGKKAITQVVAKDYITLKISKGCSDYVKSFFTADESVKKNIAFDKLMVVGKDGALISLSEAVKAFLEPEDELPVAAEEEKPEIVGVSYTVYVRKSAADKKPASGYVSVDVADEADAPMIELEKRNEDVEALKFKLASGKNYEYAVVAKNDFAGNLIDWTSLTWKKITTSTQLKAGLKITKYKKTDAAGTVVAAATATKDSVILLREAGSVSGNKAVLPSKLASYAILKNDTGSKKISAVAASFDDGVYTFDVDIKGDGTYVENDTTTTFVKPGKDGVYVLDLSNESASVQFVSGSLKRDGKETDAVLTAKKTIALKDVTFEVLDAEGEKLTVAEDCKVTVSGAEGSEIAKLTCTKAGTYTIVATTTVKNADGIDQKLETKLVVKVDMLKLGAIEDSKKVALVASGDGVYTVTASTPAKPATETEEAVAAVPSVYTVTYSCAGFDTLPVEATYFVKKDGNWKAAEAGKELIVYKATEDGSKKTLGGTLTVAEGVTGDAKVVLTSEHGTIELVFNIVAPVSAE